jgi:hypothetical protein
MILSVIGHGRPRNAGISTRCYIAGRLAAIPDGIAQALAIVNARR